MGTMVTITPIDFYSRVVFEGFNRLRTYQESVAGSVIQGTGMVEFEDGLWIANYQKAGNDLQRVRIIPGVQSGAMRTPKFLQGQTEI